MKDKIFIGWSGNYSIGQNVKTLLETKYDYSCKIGGNLENDSKSISIGDTVVNQIKEANQAIFIFQNKENGAVSNNLFFELGYALSLHGVEKVHCVKRADDKIVLPSDFDNSFVEPIVYKDDNQFSEDIVKFFFSRQKLNIKEEKYYLINNRYLIKDKIRAYNSIDGSKCSDYELAQYILFYYEAASMFSERAIFLQEMNDFLRLQSRYFSKELNLAVQVCINESELNQKIQLNSMNQPFITDEDYYDFKEQISYFKNQIEKDGIGCFGEWLEFFVSQWDNYAAYLYSFNPNPIIGKDKALELSYNKAQEAWEKLNELIPILIRVNPADEIGIIAKYKSHIYRTLYLVLTRMGDVKKANDYLEDCINIRKKMLMDFKGKMDQHLYDNLNMEYFLTIVDKYENNPNNTDIDVLMYKKQMVQYLQRINSKSTRSKHIELIESFVNSNS